MRAILQLVVSSSQDIIRVSQCEVFDPFCTSFHNLRSSIGKQMGPVKEIRHVYVYLDALTSIVWPD